MARSIWVISARPTWSWRRSETPRQILLAGEIEGNNSYQSYWLALKEKPYNKVEDLKGKPVAFASKTSTSGYLIPMYDLKRKGLLTKPNAGGVLRRGQSVLRHRLRLRGGARLNGQAEAAAVSYYVLDKDKHLTAEQRAKLKKVAEQGPVPTHIIAVRSSISEADRATLRKALQTMNEKENEELRDKVFTSKLVEVIQRSTCGRSARRWISSAMQSDLPRRRSGSAASGSDVAAPPLDQGPRAEAKRPLALSRISTGKCRAAALSRWWARPASANRACSIASPGWRSRPKAS